MEQRSYHLDPRQIYFENREGANCLVDANQVRAMPSEIMAAQSQPRVFSVGPLGHVGLMPSLQSEPLFIQPSLTQDRPASLTFLLNPTLCLESIYSSSAASYTNVHTPFPSCPPSLNPICLGNHSVTASSLNVSNAIISSANNLQQISARWQQPQEYYARLQFQNLQRNLNQEGLPQPIGPSVPVNAPTFSACTVPTKRIYNKQITKCHFCSYTAHASNVTKHENRIHKKIEFFCECGQGFTQQCFLNIHKRIHQDKKLKLYVFKCETCSWLSTTKGAIDLHKKCHPELAGSTIPSEPIPVQSKHEVTLPETSGVASPMSLQIDESYLPIEHIDASPIPAQESGFFVQSDHEATSPEFSELASPMSLQIDESCSSIEHMDASPILAQEPSPVHLDLEETSPETSEVASPKPLQMDESCSSIEHIDASPILAQEPSPVHLDLEETSPETSEVASPKPLQMDESCSSIEHIEASPILAQEPSPVHLDPEETSPEFSELASPMSLQIDESCSSIEHIEASPILAQEPSPVHLDPEETSPETSEVASPKPLQMDESCSSIEHIEASPILAQEPSPVHLDPEETSPEFSELASPMSLQIDESCSSIEHIEASPILAQEPSPVHLDPEETSPETSEVASPKPLQMDESCSSIEHIEASPILAQEPSPVHFDPEETSPETSEVASPKPLQMDESCSSIEHIDASPILAQEPSPVHFDPEETSPESSEVASPKPLQMDDSCSSMEHMDAFATFAQAQNLIQKAKRNDIPPFPFNPVSPKTQPKSILNAAFSVRNSHFCQSLLTVSQANQIFKTGNLLTIELTKYYLASSNLESRFSTQTVNLERTSEVEPLNVNYHALEHQNAQNVQQEQSFVQSDPLEIAQTSNGLASTTDSEIDNHTISQPTEVRQASPPNTNIFPNLNSQSAHPSARELQKSLQPDNSYEHSSRKGRHCCFASKNSFTNENGLIDQEYGKHAYSQSPSPPTDSNDNDALSLQEPDTNEKSDQHIESVESVYQKAAQELESVLDFANTPPLNLLPNVNSEPIQVHQSDPNTSQQSSVLIDNKSNDISPTETTYSDCEVITSPQPVNHQSVVSNEVEHESNVSSYSEMDCSSYQVDQNSLLLQSDHNSEPIQLHQSDCNTLEQFLVLADKESLNVNSSSESDLLDTQIVQQETSLAQSKQNENPHTSNDNIGVDQACTCALNPELTDNSVLQWFLQSDPKRIAFHKCVQSKFSLNSFPPSSTVIVNSMFSLSIESNHSDESQKVPKVPKSTVSNEPLVVCKKCQKTFTKRQYYSKHIKLAHMYYCSKDTKFPQTDYFRHFDCFRQFTSMIELLEHRLDDHLDDTLASESTKRSADEHQRPLHESRAMGQYWEAIENSHIPYDLTNSTLTESNESGIISTDARQVGQKRKLPTEPGTSGELPAKITKR